MALVYRLVGPLNREALRRSFEEVVRRHQALRTTFPSIGGVPRQVVTECRPWELRLVDFYAESGAVDEARCTQFAQVEARRPFDLAVGPLLRTTLLRTGADEHLLFTTAHHIVADGWSFGILWNEVSALYAAFARGEALALPPLPVQYADYAVWQRAWLQGDELERQLAYWRDRLAGAQEQTALPF